MALKLQVTVNRQSNFNIELVCNDYKLQPTPSSALQKEGVLSDRSPTSPLPSTVHPFNPPMCPTHHMTSQLGPKNETRRTAMSYNYDN